MDWFRVDSDIARHPKIVKLAHKLHISSVQALGHVIALFGCVAEHAESGDVSDVDDDGIEEWALWRGDRELFARAIAEVGILDVATRTIHGWEERHEATLRERVRAKDRVRAFRQRSCKSGERNARNADVTPNISGTEPDRTEPNRTIEPPMPPLPAVRVRVSSSDVSAPGPQTFEAIEPRAAPVKRWRAHLRQYLPDDAALQAAVEAEIVAVARENGTKPAAYANRIMERRERVLEIAARCREARAEPAKARGPPAGGGGAEHVGAIVAKIFGGGGGP